jgi:hypothetical protein
MYDNFDLHAAAESLPLDEPPAPDWQAAAARMTARHARDKDDLAELLAALALPGDPDTITALLPLIPDPADDSPAGPDTTGDDPAMPDQAPGVNAFEAMALSMHNAGDTIPAITEATGMTQQELEDLIAAHTTSTDPGDADATSPGGEQTAPSDDDQAAAHPGEHPSTEDSIAALLERAEHHTLAGIRNRAARIRADLTDFADRRATEQATAEAEARVAALRKELEQAEATLRAAKNGHRPATPAAPAESSTVTALPVPASADDTAASRKRSKDELARIRAWARDHGHQVADRGLPPKYILQAYDAATAAPAAQAG